MRMHRLITVILLAFSYCVLILGASQSGSMSEFWLTAPDKRPGAPFNGSKWNAKDVFSRAAVRQDQPNRPVRGPARPTDPFTMAFFAAQEDGREPLAPGVEVEKAVPKERATEKPTIFAGPVVGAILLAAGLAGWIALAIGAWMLDRARAS